MRKLRFAVMIFITGILAWSCKKTSFITSADALLSTSIDTLHYDTVFTSTGSITQSFKIFNLNNQKLRLSNIQLMGGSGSFFSMNVDGTPGSSFNDIEVEANDSLYIFVKLYINPNASNLPFLVQDSIRIQYNGNTRFIQLDAYGQNARFMRGQWITQDTTWTNELPIVILGGLLVNQGKTLTINKGCKVYAHADAPIVVNGTLTAVGDATQRISFAGDRLDDPYKDYPGSWPGIIFTETSSNNNLQFCNIKNAYQGVIVQDPSINSNPKLRLQQCILDNIYDVAIGGSNSSIEAANCLVSNCGYNVYLSAGGTYNFTHCTLSSYGNNYMQHKYPVLTVSNAAGGGLTNNLTCTITNSIIYGEGGIVDDEIAVNKQGSTPFSLTLNNVLYKVKANDPANAIFNNCLKNELPIFDSIDIGNRYFDFHLRQESPCINKGIASGLITDLDGNNRNVGLPDLGCYEKQ